MKDNYERYRDFFKWEKSFAIHPVKLISGKWVWLKTVERRFKKTRVYPDVFYEYRLIDKDKKS